MLVLLERIGVIAVGISRAERASMIVGKRSESRMRVLRMKVLGLPTIVGPLFLLFFAPSIVQAAEGLFQAIQKGSQAQVETLLSGGTDVNARDDNGLTPLMVAAFLGRVDVVRLLLQKGADVNARDLQGEGALIKASAAGRDEVVGLLLKKGADVNAKELLGIDSLMVASFNGADR